MEEFGETQAEYQLTLQLERALLLSSKHKHHVEHKIQNAHASNKARVTQ